MRSTSALRCNCSCAVFVVLDGALGLLSISTISVRIFNYRCPNRSHAEAARSESVGLEDPPTDRRASLRNSQGMDGLDALPHSNFTARQYRDELARARIQHETIAVHRVYQDRPFKKLTAVVSTPTAAEYTFSSGALPAPRSGSVGSLVLVTHLDRLASNGTQLYNCTCERLDWKFSSIHPRS
jgi:hypothetical protein